MTDAPAPRRTLGRALVSPRSIGLLLLALVLAGVFAALAQWQVSRAVEAGTVVERETESVVPLTRIAEPGAQQTQASVGQLAATSGRLVPEDTVVVGERLNRGEPGWWVVGHAVLDDPAGAQLAVGLGWTADERAAERAAAAVRGSEVRLVGRYVDGDPAEPTESGSTTALTAVAPARLVNLWDPAETGPTYEGVLTLQEAPAGLDAIWSPRPSDEVRLNLLNVLYAAEWVLFAVFALYVWYRLVRDRWELEQQADPAAEPVPADA